MGKAKVRHWMEITICWFRLIRIKININIRSRRRKKRDKKDDDLLA